MESDSHIHIQLECTESARKQIIAPCSCHREVLRHSTSIHKTHTHSLWVLCVHVHTYMHEPTLSHTDTHTHMPFKSASWTMVFASSGFCFTCLWLHQLFWPIYLPVSAWYICVCSYIAVVCLSCWKIWGEKIKELPITCWPQHDILTDIDKWKNCCVSFWKSKLMELNPFTNFS